MSLKLESARRLALGVGLALASHIKVSTPVLSVQVLVDRAVESATRPPSGGGDTFESFAHDLLAAVSGTTSTSGQVSPFDLLGDVVPPNHRRLVAWALMRYLAARGAFPAHPPELRPRAMAFVRAQLVGDLEVHRVDLEAQSHELEDALSQIVPSIEQDIHQAIAFRGLDTLASFQQRLLSTINSRRNFPLLYAFSNRSLVDDALKTSFNAVKAFLDADAIALLEMYDQAVATCKDAQNELRTEGTVYASLLASVPTDLQKAVETKIQGLSSAQPASLSLDPFSKKYPFHTPQREIDLRFMLQHSGTGTAFDVAVTVESTNELEIARETIRVGTLSPHESRPLRFPAHIVKPEAIALLSATVEWTNFNRQTDRCIHEVELEAQDPSIDWPALAQASPYALRVALGDRFVGRQSFLSELLSHVLGPHPASWYLWGQKRVGKTSLVRALADEVHSRTPEVAVAYLETITETTVEETTNGLCRRLISKLRDSDDRFKDVLEPQYTGTLSPLSDFLDQLHVIDPEKKVLLILDEFDELPVELYKGRGVADAFFQHLGKGIAGKDGVSVILVGGERIPAIIRAQGMRLNMYKPQHIDHFERSDEFADLVRQPGWPLEFTDDAIDVLWDYSDGNPYFLNEICSRLAEMMIARRDAHITGEEVQEALVHTLHSIESNSFAHYWADGIVDLDPDQADATLTDRTRFLAAVAAVLGHSGSVMPTAKLAEESRERGCTTTTFERLLREFQLRGVVVEVQGGFQLRVRLFEEWLKGRGAVELNTFLWDDLGNRERIEVESLALIGENEIYEISESWGPYQGSQVSAFAIQQWLSQFGSVQDQRLMFTVLKGVRFYRDELVREKFKQVHRAISAGLTRKIRTGREHRRDILVCHFGSAARSGASMARTYRHSNEIWHENCISANDIANKLHDDTDIVAIVAVDDYVGTGRTAERQLSDFFEGEEKAIALIQERGIAFWYAVAAGTDSGILHVRRFLEEGPVQVSVIAGDELGKEDRAFDSQSKIWMDDNERMLAEEIAKSWGQRLEGRGALGFGGLQGLVVFEHNCPNTSLPILYKQRKAMEGAFQPLFPRSS